MPGPFQNEPLTDFSNPVNKAAFEAALETLQAEAAKGKPYPLIIGGKRVMTKDTFATTNPAKPAQVLGVFAKAGVKEAKAAVAAADKAFADWARQPAFRRADVLLKAAAGMRARKHEFSATMVLEEGKNWVEADADTAEAIDFMEYYAREMLRYDRGMDVVEFPHETNETFYIPLGVISVIPPWNFPNAILCGMTVAALVTGNTVCLKPASEAPLIGWKVAELLYQSGLPAGVLNFVPGPGRTCGEELVLNPRVRMICFTGSMEVGLRIAENAGKLVPGQIWIKRFIAEMGGKDTALVDETADVDFAAQQVAMSAFGFQGQKCSACSRCLVVDKVYDNFKARLLAHVAKIKVGPVTDPANFMGPVINKDSLDKCLKYVGIGKRQGKVIAGGNKLKIDGGWFIEPTVVEGVKFGSPIDQEEIFGPVLGLFKVKDFEHGLKMANNTKYGLTGGLFSNVRDRLDRAKREFHVGNLYLNRKITGALVGVQPFGGFNMSGTDSKAGGRDYLGLFLQAKTVCERF